MKYIITVFWFGIFPMMAFPYNGPLTTCCNIPAPSNPNCFGIQLGGDVILKNLLSINNTVDIITMVFTNGKKITLFPSRIFWVSSLAFSKEYLDGRIDGDYVAYDKNNQQIAHGYINLLNGVVFPGPSEKESWCREDAPDRVWCNDNGYQNVCRYDAAGRFIDVGIWQGFYRAPKKAN